jgi:hypothetical protein
MEAAPMGGFLFGLIALELGLTAAAALADSGDDSGPPLSIAVVNETDRPLAWLTLDHVGPMEFATPLAPGGRTTVAVAPGSAFCTFDARAMFADGAAAWGRVNVCREAVVRVVGRGGAEPRLAPDYRLSVRVRNDTAVAIRGVTTEIWREGEAAIPVSIAPGQTAEVVLPQLYAQTCRIDLQALFADGAAATRERVEPCRAEPPLVVFGPGDERRPSSRPLAASAPQVSARSGFQPAAVTAPATGARRVRIENGWTQALTWLGVDGTRRPLSVRAGGSGEVALPGDPGRGCLLELEAGFADGGVAHALYNACRAPAVVKLGKGWDGRPGQLAPRGLGIEVVNDTGRRLVRLYADGERALEPSEDFLGEGVVAPGASVRLGDVYSGQLDCRYTVRAVFDDGSEARREGLDLCRGEPLVVRFTEADRTGG